MCNKFGFPDPSPLGTCICKSLMKSGNCFFKSSVGISSNNPVPSLILVSEANCPLNSASAIASLCLKLLKFF